MTGVEDLDASRREVRAGALRLATSPRIEGKIRMTLKTVLRIPRGLGVPNEIARLRGRQEAMTNT